MWWEKYLIKFYYAITIYIYIQKTWQMGLVGSRIPVPAVVSSMSSVSLWHCIIKFLRSKHIRYQTLSNQVTKCNKHVKIVTPSRLLNFTRCNYAFLSFHLKLLMPQHVTLLSLLVLLFLLAGEENDLNVFSCDSHPPPRKRRMKQKSHGQQVHPSHFSCSVSLLPMSSSISGSAAWNRFRLWKRIAKSLEFRASITMVMMPFGCLDKRYLFKRFVPNWKRITVTQLNTIITNQHPCDEKANWEASELARRSAFWSSFCGSSDLSFDSLLLSPFFPSFLLRSSLFFDFSSPFSVFSLSVSDFFSSTPFSSRLESCWKIPVRAGQKAVEYAFHFLIPFWWLKLPWFTQMPRCSHLTMMPSYPKQAVRNC